jgi:HK97 family phage prohead protease
MTDFDTRAWRADLAHTEGRTISGIAVPFNSPTTVYEAGRIFDETWLPGSTKEAIARRGDRMRLLGFHDSRAFPIGKPTQMQDRTDGMWFEAYIADTRDGNDALELLKIGALDGVSVGFSVPDGGDSWTPREDGTYDRTISRANIREFSLVNFPAFDDARVTSIREAQSSEEAKKIEAEILADLEAKRFRLQVLRTRALAR